MQFSVLMSVYKNDNPVHFQLALESVTKCQILKPDQVVVVFDGPVSSKIEDAVNYVKNSNKSIQFDIIKLADNKGLAAALNIGLSACKYEYIARMDADDIAVDIRFEHQIDYMEKHPEIDVLGGVIAEFSENPHNITSIRKVGYTHTDIVQMAKRRTPFNHMTVVYKKSKVMAVGGYNPNFGKLEDYKLWVDLLSLGCRMANLDEILVYMRVGNGFIQRRSSRREIQDWDHLQKDLINAGITTRLDSILNRVYIRGFTFLPSGIKKIAYKLLLRKRIENSRIRDNERINT